MGKLRRLGLWGVAAVLLGSMAAMAFFASPMGLAVRTALQERNAHEWIRHAQRRLQGHDKLETVLLPPLLAWQRKLERTPPAGPLPSLGKGQQTTAIQGSEPSTGRLLTVSTPQEIRDALQQATPGTRIEIAPGLYPFQRNLRLGHDGSATQPLVLSAREPGSVVLEFAQDEGFLVDRPHWIFENLHIRGVCARQRDCEHAFHVVGKAAFTTLRNNRIEDFNAHIKVNGLGPDWPDNGLVEFNTLSNRSPRETELSVVPFDLVGASNWRVQDNLVRDFVKRDGNQVSFGIFMKGASRGGTIERNLVICTSRDISQPGVRVGISFGGGGTDPGACRSDRCLTGEHSNGLAANNVVAHCNDSGIDINHSRNTLVAHNTLINTAGIAVRRAPAEAKLYGNLYEGRATARDGSLIEGEHNTRIDASEVFQAADRLDLRWATAPGASPAHQFVTRDFFRQTRAPSTYPGATGPQGELFSQ